jgi:dihydroxyacetone kinase-like protein
VLEREPASVGDPFDGASTGFLRTGGTSGPLFGMWFRAFAQAGADRAAIDLDELAAAAEEGLAAVRRLGGAEVGDKTMVDALAPAVGALLAGAEDGAELEAALSAAAVAARAGAEATADLVARRGRASYVGEVARGVIDPGAVTAALFFEAAVEAPPVTH